MALLRDHEYDTSLAARRTNGYRKTGRTLLFRSSFHVGRRTARSLNSPLSRLSELQPSLLQRHGHMKPAKSSDAR